MLKTGIFKDVVDWCLVVTTPEEVILCALARESSIKNTIATTHNSSLRLVPTRYIVPTDSVPILSICGTDDGRIFLGGYDGNLYEMSYEGFFQNNGSSKGYMYDGENESNGPTDVVTYLASGSKRAMSALLFGPNSTSNRPRKCRKLNHTAAAPTLVSALVPGFVLAVASTVFGTGSAAGSVAGPIVHLAMDNERNALYALTSKGFVHAFDLSNDKLGGNSTPRLACSIDVTKSARCYLEMIIRGRSMSSSSSYVASISFTGGASGAQNGVGGTDGAREILKMADTEIEKAKLNTAKNRRTQNNSSSVAGFYFTATDDQSSEGILSPVSIHVIPPSESKSLTLLVVTGSGLRYFMSTLAPSQSSNSYGNQRQFRSRNRIHLCHIRALPPFKTGQDGDLSIDFGSSVSNNTSRDVVDPKTFGAIYPRVQLRGRNDNGQCSVKRSYYKHGFTVMAIDSTSKRAEKSSNGNTIITLSTDCYENNNAQLMKYNQHQQITNVSGISESLTSPLAQNASQSKGQLNSLLPGGTIWDMTKLVSGSEQKFSSMLYLQTHSSTPTDAELDLEIVPAYFPPSRIRRRSLKQEGKPHHLADSLSIVSHSFHKNLNGGSLSQKNSSFASSAIEFLSSLIFNTPLTNPGLYSQYTSVSNNGLGKTPNYKISERYGCGPMGFSQPTNQKIGASRNIAVPKTRQSRNSSTYFRRDARHSGLSQSPPLSRWLVSPSAVPLSESVLKPITSNTTSEGFLALNSGGLHLFNVSSTLDNISTILSESNTSNISGDENVKSIFTKYGYDEGCSMCLSVAISGENEVMKRKAVQAALSFAHRPALVPSYGMTETNGSTISSSDFAGDKQTTIEIPRGYSFQSSFLYDGLIALTSRLLRPIWCKPAVVVTEGRTIKSKKYGGTPVVLPANVELLLDNATLEEIRRPLVALQNLLRDVFAPAVNVVPGAPKEDFSNGSKMDIDEPVANGGNNGHDVISRALQYQSRTIPRNNVGFQDPTDKDLNQIARLVEDRNVHSLYRLVARSVQLLTLMSHLQRAHSIPEIPEVEWGLLHGLTYCQLATTRHGQNRIETILTNLVSSNESHTSNGDSSAVGTSKTSVEANNLSALFASQCYLYFSAGSQLTHLGFRVANTALSYPPNSDEKKTFTSKAASFFRIAARNWINPSLIAGRLLSIENSNRKVLNNGSTTNNQWYDEVTDRAYTYGSPLARAASILLDLGDVGTIVDLCLICAGNFGGTKLVNFANDDDTLTTDADKSRLAWEKDLYHRQTTNKSNTKGKRVQSNQTSQVGFSLTNKSNSSDLVSGIEVTSKDAQKTCYAVLFHHLFSLLDSSTTSAVHLEAAEQMVAVAASSQNVGFLNMFFKTMLDSGYVDTMLRIDSPDLESWLSDVESNPVLLWRYYIIHGLDWKAGEIMWQRARSSADKKINLSERMECLTRALNSYTAALEKDDRSKKSIGKPGIPASNQLFANGAVSQSRKPSSDELNRIMTQVSEEIDVATIQRRILTVVESSKSTYQLNDDKFEKLSFSLLNVTDLYNDYAASLALYDICLLILNTCQHNDPATIDCLWKSIICEEVLPCKTHSSEVISFLEDLKRGSLLVEEDIVLIEDKNDAAQNDSMVTFETGEWVSRLKNRVLSLGQELWGKGADFTFPLEFITSTLEGAAASYFSSLFSCALKLDEFSQTKFFVLSIHF